MAHTIQTRKGDVMKKYFACMVALFLTGCPMEENPSHCAQVMRCTEDKEMICDKNDSGCGENCHYYVVEHCYEECEEIDGGSL